MTDRNLSDFDVALKMRDITKKIVRDVLVEDGYYFQYGTVVDIDRPGFRCQVAINGQVGADPVWIAMDSVQPSDIGAVVRIGGLGGDRFIDDVLGLHFHDAPVIPAGEVDSDEFGNVWEGPGAAANLTPNIPFDPYGTGNTAVGYQALQTPTGFWNVAIGYQAFQSSSFFPSHGPARSVAIGAFADVADLGGGMDWGTAVGASATAAEWGTAIGAGAVAIQGAIALGYQADASSGGISIGNGYSVERGISIGHGSAEAVSGTGHIVIGDTAYIDANYDCLALGSLAAVVGGSGVVQSIAIGVYAFVNNAANAIAMGWSAVVEGDRAIAIGWNANATGEDSVAVGSGTCARLASTAIGYDALHSATTGSGWNTAVGAQALQNCLGGDSNTAVGNFALQALTTGSENTAVGDNAAQSITSGGQNVAMGEAALDACITGYYNVAVGSQALGNVTGNSNTAVGYQTYGASGVDYSTMLGAGTSATANGAVAIGVDHLGNGAVSSVTDLIVLGTANHRTRIPGLGAFASGDKYLVVDSSGNIHKSALGPAS